MTTPTPRTERSEMPTKLRRINSHQITHERAATVIEELIRELATVTAQRDRLLELASALDIHECVCANCEALRAELEKQDD